MRPWRPPLLVIVGITGTGKSELSLELAESLGGEIIGCDSLQVYCGFDVATAKPGAEEIARVPHHLVSHVDPSHDFTMAEYACAAEARITEIDARGKVPLVVGGTGLYLRGLLRGIVSVPPRNPGLRERLHGMVRRRGAERLHRWLGRLDPASSRRVHRGDSQRIVRAIETALTDDQTWSERLSREGTWPDGVERYPNLKVGLEMERGKLRARLDARVDAFFDNGLVEEVRDLLARGVPARANAFKAIGYREVLAALESGRDPGATREEVKRNTWRYARRQRTWFRKEPGVIWLDAARGTKENAGRAARMWHRWVAPLPD